MIWKIFIFSFVTDTRLFQYVGRINMMNSNSVKNNDLNSTTLHLESIEEFNSKEGFWVVAAIKIMVPSSRSGKNKSCCNLLK